MNDIVDVTWSSVVEQMIPRALFVYEGGPQPRDKRGRFRKRESFGILLEESNAKNIDFTVNPSGIVQITLSFEP